jgi:hypothetical protein
MKSLDKTKPFAVVLIKTDDLIVLMYNREKTFVQAFHTETDAVRWFEDGYNRAHSRSYEGSISACINRITLQPSVIVVENMDALVREFAEPDGTVRLMQAGTSLAWVYGVDVTSKAQKRWADGVKPRLIPS